MKNVLFIVYYFPPMGGSGVQRPLKFIKYLRDFGWNPIVVCPEPGMYTHFDDSLKKELDTINPKIHRVAANTLFHSAGNSAKDISLVPEWGRQAIRRLLRLFMFPDNKKGWIDPAIEKSLSVINEQQIDLIFSTAPPFSNHMVAAELHKQTGIPSILDYRDAWLNNHFMKDLYGWQKRKMKNLEKQCLQQAEGVVALDEYMLSEMNKSYTRAMPEGKVIPHGFDAKDFEDTRESNLDYREGKLNILYSGLFYESNQPDIFIQGLKKAVGNGAFKPDDIFLHFQGGIDARIAKLLDEAGFKGHYKDYGYVSHMQAVANLKKADLLWMISNFDASFRQIKSGKLFEYIGSKKPVLGLLQPGAAWDLLDSYAAGFVAKVGEPDDIAGKLAELYSQWEKGWTYNINPQFLQQYERKYLSGRLAEFFDEISSKTQKHIS